MPADPARAETSAPSRSTLVWAVRVLAVEAVVLSLLVIFLGYEDLTAQADTEHGALAVTLYTAVLAVLLGGLAVALWRHRAWARGPAIVLQLLLLPIGYTMVIGGLWWLGLVAMAVGVCGAATLLAPATRAALGMK